MDNDYIRLIPADRRHSSRIMSSKVDFGSCDSCEEETTFDRLSQFSEEELFFESSVDFDDETCQAPSLQDMYRYHVFFSHHADDIDWVRKTINKLQVPPFCYQCYYLCDKFNRRLSIIHNLQCALMLSERVVMVLTKQYLQETWPHFQAMMKSLTSISLSQKRMLVVVLEDCGIPLELERNDFLDARNANFFPVFVTKLKSDCLPRCSQSVNSDVRESPSEHLANGHILANVEISICGLIRPHLTVRQTDKEVPSALRWHGINMSKEEYTELIRNITHVHRSTSRLPWVFSMQPVLVLLSVFGLWVVIFVMLIIIPVDDVAGDILPIRLIVFVVPLILLSLLYTVRWKRRKIKRKISREMIRLCIHLNSLLYTDERPLVLTAGHSKGRKFNLYFVYFNISDCTADVDLLLQSCMTEDVGKLSLMCHFYTTDSHYLSQATLAERLTVMMAAAFTLKLTNYMLPFSPQQRHTDKLLCLCQFTEECLSSYVHFVTKEDVSGLVQLFSVNLFCTITSSDIRCIFENMLSV